MRIGIGIGVGFGGGTSWSSYWTPTNKGDILAGGDGTILTVGVNKYWRSLHDRNFLITNYDFPSDWTKGIPYKSAATISAPAGDAVLIAADVNNFLYAIDGTPNQIPVVSLFQNIEYANKIFFKHADQVVDGNGVETYEPRVLEWAIYSSARTGADLTACNSYYGVPAELTSGIKWGAFVNGTDDVAYGTKIAPYKTINYAITRISATNTIYAKTAENTEANGVYNILLQKACTIQGTGFNVLKGGGTGLANALLRIDIATVVCNINNLIFDGTGGYDTGILAEQTNKTFNKCLIKNIDTYAANLRGGAKIKDCIITHMMVYAVSGITYIDSCYLYTACLYCIYVDSATGDLRLTNSKLQTRNGNTSWVYLNNLTNATVLGNTFNIDHVIKPIHIPSVTAATFTFTYNTYNVSANLVQEIFNQASAGNTWVIDNNTFNIINTSMVNAIIGIDNPTTLSVQGNKFISESLAQVAAVITKSTGTVIIATTKKNYIQFKNINGSYHICYGTEGSGANNNKLDGSEISENHIRGAIYFDSSLIPTDIVHGIFVGYNKDINIRYNRVHGAGYGIITKGAGMVNSTGMIANNVIINCNQGIRIKGQKGWFIYNNTIISDTEYSTTPIVISNNAGVDECDDNVVKNNIIIYLGTANTNMIIDYGSNSDIDYNIYYCPNSIMTFSVAGVAKSFEEWQALGKDTHSIVLNDAQYLALFTDPATRDYSLKAGCVAIGAGVDLGTTYDDGLDASTDWGDSTTIPEVVTKQQGASWDIGAYVH